MSHTATDFGANLERLLLYVRCGERIGAASGGLESGRGGNKKRSTSRTTTTGFSASCSCGSDVVPATILDPFMGSGTSALVARRLGRKAVGIELNTTYAEMCARRLQQLSLLA